MKATAEKKPGRPPDDALRASRTEQILQAATELFAKHGYAGTDTQVLAEKLGVGKGTIYRYFPSKEDLFLATADRVMRQLRGRIDGCIKDVVDPLDQMAVAIRAYLGFFAEHPAYVELLIQERATFKDRKEPTYFEYCRANVEPWLARYRALIAQGRLRDMPVHRISDVLSDLCYGTMFTNYFTGHRKPFDVQAQDILDVVFHGILSDSERRAMVLRGDKR